MRERILRVLPWALFGAALIAAVVFFALWQRVAAEQRAEAEVRATAQEFVTRLTNFSADTIEQDARQIRFFAVGQFAKEVDVFFGDRAIAAIKEAEASSEGEVDSIFVQSLDEETATVFAVVSETVSNVNTEEPRTDILRLEVSMVETESGWRVDRVDILQSPGTGPVDTGS